MAKFSITITFILLLTACANSDLNTVENTEQMNEQHSISLEADLETEPSSAANTIDLSVHRMIVQEAELTIAVKGINTIMDTYLEKVKSLDGYMVQSSIYEMEKGKKRATVLARVPSDRFDEFLSFVEATSAEIQEKNVRGQDVTEEYVDLHSRLKAKEIVEERLFSFMNNAEKTEDLLKISAELGKVQEEIEQLEGKIKYLENQTSFSAITINMHDTEVIIPSINHQDTNAMQQVKKIFMESINGIKTLFSNFIIYFVGFSPVWILLIVVGSFISFLIKKRKKAKIK